MTPLYRVQLARALKARRAYSLVTVSPTVFVVGVPPASLRDTLVDVAPLWWQASEKRPSKPRRAKNPNRVRAALLAWERRRESDDRVARELEHDPAMLEAWHQHKRSIAGRTAHERFERFTHYMHDHSEALAGAWEALEDCSGYGQESEADYLARVGN